MIPPVIAPPVVIPPVTVPAVIAAAPFVHHHGAPAVHHPRGVVPQVAGVGFAVVAAPVIRAAIVAAVVIGAVVPIVSFRILARLGHQRAGDQRQHAKG
jgi:uncharacterized protein (DUF2062 family)